jgi:hypothetical protein
MVGLPIWASLCKGNFFFFFVGWPFCKGPSRRVGVVLKKTKIYQMILKNIWLFPIAYCDAAEPWHLMAPANQVYPFATTF